MRWRHRHRLEILPPITSLTLTKSPVIISLYPESRGSDKWTGLH